MTARSPKSQEALTSRRSRKELRRVLRRSREGHGTHGVTREAARGQAGGPRGHGKREHTGHGGARKTLGDVRGQEGTWRTTREAGMRENREEHGREPTGRGPREPLRPGRQQGQSSSVATVCCGRQRVTHPGQGPSSPPRIWSPACTGNPGHPGPKEGETPGSPAADSQRRRLLGLPLPGGAGCAGSQEKHGPAHLDPQPDMGTGQGRERQRQ